MPTENTSARTSGDRKQSSTKKSSSFGGAKRSSGARSGGKSFQRAERTPGLGSSRNVKRGDSAGERTSQPRGERSERSDRNDRSERGNYRGERSSQPRGERSDRGERKDRGDRNSFRGERSSQPRGERSDRGERIERSDRGGFRGDRNESRGERSGAPRHGRGGSGTRNSGGFRNHRGSTGGSGNYRGGSGGGSRGGRGGGGRYGSKMKALDPNLFINDVVEITPETKVEITNSFADFAFDDRLTQSIIKKGYVTPTPIQDQTIHFALEGRDVLGMANTGTGKTAAFVLPIINTILKQRGQRTTALVIAPVRELAQQIDQEFRSFTAGMKLFSTLCVGGLSIHKQKLQLRRDPQVVVGTPGRLKDLYQQGVLNLDDISMFVLDEVDLMLDMGFIDDIRFLVDKIPVERQTLCFSATMTDSIKRLLDTVMTDPVSVSVKTADTSSNVKQDVIYAKSSNEKWNKLITMFDDDDFEKILVFCETKSFVQQLCDNLNDLGVHAEAIHGDKSQPQRQRALKKFKDNQVQVLVATDVAARGLDIPNVSHVVNYDAPRAYEDYVHRIGRTGRAGKLGKAITFVKS